MGVNSVSDASWGEALASSLQLGLLTSIQVIGMATVAFIQHSEAQSTSRSRPCTEDFVQSNLDTLGTIYMEVS